jgi:hypothetical protein
LAGCCQPPPDARPCPYTRQILDDNQGLILSIMENQNLGKLEQCAQCVGGDL